MKSHKECPICGGKAGARISTPDEEAWVIFNFIVCSECGLSTDTFDTVEQAWEAWDKRPEVKRGSIVQITDTNHQCYPCLVIVTEVMSWGIQGYLQYPLYDNFENRTVTSLIRLSTGNYERVGDAIIVEEKAWEDK